MKFNKTLLALLAAVSVTAGCGKVQQIQNSLGSGSGVKGPANGMSLPTLTGDNVLQMTVSGSLCSGGSYINKPCVQITVCEPSSGNCQTVNDILVDTGSFGLRIFKQSISSLSLPGISSGSGSLAECAMFGDGSSEWGPVSSASLKMANEPAVTVPVQVIDSTYPGESVNCPGSDANPAAAGFNGILGVGLFTQDCGTGCTPTAHGTNVDNGMYFSCTAAGCTGAEVALANQVQNPVSSLPVDNNGVILELPSVPFGGAGWADGYLILGIDTKTNNSATNVTKFAADSLIGEFTTQFNGHNYSSFIDSGSNGIFFSNATASNMTTCGSNAPGWYCPNDTALFSAKTVAAGVGGNSATIPFSVGNAYSLMSSGNGAFIEVGGSSSSAFDWGLPFYLGRNVYVGIMGKSSSLGAGPYWAY